LTTELEPDGLVSSFERLQNGVTRSQSSLMQETTSIESFRGQPAIQ